MESRLNEYFNTACFAPAVLRRETSGRPGEIFCADPISRTRTFRLSSIFPITERTKLEFRSEFFNAFNTVSFANPVNILASANVGQIVETTTGPRVIQFALKLNF